MATPYPPSPPSNRPPAPKPAPKPPGAQVFSDGHRERMQRGVQTARAQQNGVDPLLVHAQRLLLNGETSTRFRQEFFDELFIESVSQLFDEWLQSSPEEVKKREYLYQVAMALGHVKNLLVRQEQLSLNVAHQMRQQDLHQDQHPDAPAPEGGV
jgi:hypothetical protein